MRSVAISGVGWSQEVRLLEPMLQSNPGGRVSLGIATAIRVREDMELYRRPNLYVPPDRVVSIIDSSRQFDFILHLTQVDDISLKSQVIRMVGTQLFTCQQVGVQINRPKIDLAQIADLRQTMAQGAEIVYPFGRKTMRRYNTDAVSLSARLQALAEVGVSTILLDNSSGQIDALTVDETADCLAFVADHWSGHIRVAGRLGDNLETVEALLTDARFAQLDFSWEAESRLRDEQDRLDLLSTMDYLTASFQLMEAFGE